MFTVQLQWSAGEDQWKKNGDSRETDSSGRQGGGEELSALPKVSSGLSEHILQQQL